VCGLDSWRTGGAASSSPDVGRTAPTPGAGEARRMAPTLGAREVGRAAPTPSAREARPAAATSPCVAPSQGVRFPTPTNSMEEAR
jgi:hypothetical protein